MCLCYNSVLILACISVTAKHIFPGDPIASNFYSDCERQNALPDHGLVVTAKVMVYYPDWY